MADHGVAPEEICMAIEDGQYIANVATVRQWLDTGGDANASARYGPPLLLLAAWYGRASIIDLLLSRGADIDATDNHGRTAEYELLKHWMAHISLAA